MTKLWSTIHVADAEYTATEVACRWAGTVIEKANLSVWAETVMRKTPENGRKS